MKKTLTTIALATVLALVLTGCASTGGGLASPILQRVARAAIEIGIACYLQEEEPFDDCAAQRGGEWIQEEAPYLVHELLDGLDLDGFDLDDPLLAELGAGVVEWTLDCLMDGQDEQCILDAARAWAGENAPEIAAQVMELVEQLLNPPADAPPRLGPHSRDAAELHRWIEECAGDAGCLALRIDSWEAAGHVRAADAMRKLTGTAP